MGGKAESSSTSIAMQREHRFESLPPCPLPDATISLDSPHTERGEARKVGCRPPCCLRRARLWRWFRTVS